MFCPNCGTENTGDSRFCSGCGSPLPMPAQDAVEEAATQINETAAQGAAFAGEAAQGAYNAVSEQAEEAVGAAQGAYEAAAAKAENAYGAAQGAYENAAAQANNAYGAAQGAYDSAAAQAAGAFGAAAAAPVFTAEQPQYSAPAGQQQYSAPVENYAPYYAAPQGPAPVAKKSKKGLLIGIIAAVVVLLAAAAAVYFLVLRPKTVEVDLSKYVSVEYEGFDGRAEALVKFDWNQLIADIGEAKKLSTDGFKTSADFVDPPEKWKNTAVFINSVSMYAVNDKGDTEYVDDIFGFRGFEDEGLKNGDKLDIKITYSEEAAKDDHLKITGNTVQFTVDGLKSVPKLDPFDGLEVSFTGTSGSGWCEYEYKGTRDDIYSYDFQCDTFSELSNGDEVVIKYIGYDEENPDWTDFIPTVTEKTYTVEDLVEYIKSVEALPASVLEAIKDETLKLAKENNDDIDEAAVSEPQLIGYMLAYADKPDFYDNNKLMFVYRSTVEPSDYSSMAYPLFYAAGYTDLKNVEDALEDAYDTEMYHGMTLPFTYDYAGGYVDPYALVEDFRDDFGDGWTVVCGGEMEDYAESDGVVHSVDDLSAEALGQLKDTAVEIMTAAAEDAYTDYGVSVDNYRIIGCITAFNPDFEQKMYSNYMMFVIAADYKLGDQTGVFYLPYFFEGVIATNDGAVATGNGKALNGEIDPAVTELSDVYGEALGRWKTDLGYSEVEVRGQELIDAIPADLLAAA